ncbi:MAG TPA: glycosyltransferase family 2 protein [Gaiellaceae bacterium]|nr:glycosyltransferase family 2 protein [Gaiellaceae bacterium]
MTELDEIPAGGTATATAPRVSIVIPCLNEAEHIEECVARAREALEAGGLDGEIIVVDNGSEDDSGALARAAGATVVDEPRRGYGSAYLAGFAAARGDYLVMIDADLTYDFAEIPGFVRKLDDGAQLVMGNRMAGIQAGAMPWLNRYIGNPLLSGFLNLIYKTPIADAHCGMRALRRDALPTLRLHSTGMEFASEMVIRAAKERLVIAQVPIALHPRSGVSKLSPFRDGWRHLRLMLVHSPTFLFIVPGAVLSIVGMLVIALVFAGASLFGRVLYLHSLIGGALLLMVGSQVVGLGLCGCAYGVHHLGERNAWFERARRRVSLEQGLLAGTVVTLAGLAAGAAIVVHWAGHDFGSLGEGRLAILAATLVVVGLQIVFTSFLLSIIGMGGSERPR